MRIAGPARSPPRLLVPRQRLPGRGADRTPARPLNDLVARLGQPGHPRPVRLRVCGSAGPAWVRQGHDRPGGPSGVVPEDARLRHAPPSRPAGGDRREPTARAGSWSSGTGPAGCTTTSGFEIDGVLRELGGAQGADAGPVGAPAGGARRGPPARVRRLRGRHPRAGSTAAATSSSGTAAPGSRYGHRRPGAGPSPTASCTPTCTARSCAAGSCWCDATTGEGGEGAVAAAAQARRARRRRAGTPRTIPRRCCQRAHQRGGEGRPGPALALGPARRRGGGVTCAPASPRPTRRSPPWTAPAARRAPGRCTAGGCG